MSFKCYCNYCGQELEAEDNWEGQKSACPKCNQEMYIFSVPRPTLKSYFYELMRFLKKVSENKKIRIFSTLNHIH